ncbi:hypothetical protein BYT27DRAFT_7202197 [Phlegmacium glaucopus]|nr:hypothetical protein BYT27DRAFT_7202197 [Phlegmacium glaucopus]
MTKTHKKTRYSGPKRPRKTAGSSIGTSAPRLSSTIMASELVINLANHPNTSLGSNSVALTKLTRFFAFFQYELEWTYGQGL